MIITFPQKDGYKILYKDSSSVTIKETTVVLKEAYS